MYNIIKKSIKRNFAYMLSAALIISTNVNIMVFANVADNVQEKYSKDLTDVNLLSGDENAPDGLKIPEEDDKSVDTQDLLTKSNIDGKKATPDSAAYMPAFNYSKVVGSYNIVISAKDGVVPDGTQVNIIQVDKVANKSVKDILVPDIEDRDLLENIVAFDITLENRGVEFQPSEGTLNVRISAVDRDYASYKEREENDDIQKTSVARVFHISNDGMAEKIKEEDQGGLSNGFDINFEVDHFSIYGVALFETVQAYSGSGLKQIQEDWFTEMNNNYIDKNIPLYLGGNQCVAVSNHYMQKIFGKPWNILSPNVGYAYQIYNNALNQYFVKIPQTLTGIPAKGDIIIWKGSFNGGAGHVAVVESADINNIHVIEQNGPSGRWVKRHHYRSYAHVRGWLHPRQELVIGDYPKPPHVHNGDKVVLVKAPTAEEDGIRELRCTEDNELFRREVIPKIPDAGVEEGYYRLKVNLGGKHVATTQNKLYGNCWDIQLNANPLEKSQIWKIIPRGSGEYRIESFQNPGFSMDSVGGSLKKENIGAALNHELPNQKWHIVKNGDYYRFVVSSSWYTLDCNQNTNNTAYTWEDNKESGCQKFTLERIKPVELLNRQLSSAMLGNQYSEQLLTAGDYVDVTKESGELPPGLELNGSGLISGVPAKEGNYTFTVRASNILGDSVHEYNINVNLNAYNVNYNNNGHGTNVTSQKAVPGTLINAPQAPVDENYNFGGWYKEAECVNMWNFAADVMPNSDLTLFAKWTLKSRGGGFGRSSGGGSGGGSGRSSGGSGSGSSGGSVSSAQGKLSSGGEWLKDSKGWWFKNRDGSYPKNAWKSISGLWYFFNSEGYMHTGWLLSNGVWYYLNGSGSGVEGKMITGWQWINKKCYYFDVISGKMSANTTTPDGYTVNADGAWTVNGSVAEQK